jgi:hypothetical protein
MGIDDKRLELGPTQPLPSQTPAVGGEAVNLEDGAGQIDAVDRALDTGRFGSSIHGGLLLLLVDVTTPTMAPRCRPWEEESIPSGWPRALDPH